MKKNNITVYWSAAETEPWKGELEVIEIKENEVICRTDDKRIKAKKGYLSIPLARERWTNSSTDEPYLKVSRDNLHFMGGFVDYNEVKEIVKKYKAA